MALPRWLARFNRRIMNRLTGPLAPYLPGFGVVVHCGRRSGRLYRTPVNVFPRRGGFVVALTYGPHSDWVRNVLADGGCVLETRGRSLALTKPRLLHDARLHAVPAPLPWIGGLARISDFLHLSRSDSVAAS
jgi:deazaflavin-dependent oxidoreductase (nitroreductase family)